jgi:hypothetical protein
MMTKQTVNDVEANEPFLLAMARLGDIECETEEQEA